MCQCGDVGDLSPVSLTFIPGQPVSVTIIWSYPEPPNIRAPLVSLSVLKPGYKIHYCHLVVGIRNKQKLLFSKKGLNRLSSLCSIVCLIPWKFFALYLPDIFEQCDPSNAVETPCNLWLVLEDVATKNVRKAYYCIRWKGCQTDLSFSLELNPVFFLSAPRHAEYKQQSFSFPTILSGGSTVSLSVISVIQ